MSPPARLADAYLVLHHASRWTDVYRLAVGHEVVLGRSSSNQIVLRSGKASRQHARIFSQAGPQTHQATEASSTPPDRDAPIIWMVEDLGSRNGVSINGRQIDGARPLTDGDVMQIAGFRISFTHDLAGHGEQTAQDSQVDPQLDSSQDDEVTQEQIDFEENAPDIISSQSGGLLQRSRTAAMSSSVGETAGPVDRALLEMAFAMGQAESPEETADIFLDTLQTIIGEFEIGLYLAANENNSLPIDPKQLPPPSYIRQRSGRRYRRPPQALLEQIGRSGNAFLARNILGDQSLATENTEGQIDVESMIAAPLGPAFAGTTSSAGTMQGLVHVLTAPDDPPLHEAHLAWIVTAGEVFLQAVHRLVQAGTFRENLKRSHAVIARLRQQLAGRVKILGRSEAIREVQHQIARVAPTAAAVLLTGESGSGKELVASAIHYASPRADGPLVCLNCAALSKDLLESELFGHEQGAFTGATQQKRGKFELASGGTLMLDEIGEMPLDLQAKLLRVLEGHSFERVGGHEAVRCDVRVVAATHRDLAAMVGQGTFRQDLFYRLNVIEIQVPPLRDRGRDCVLLAKHFLQTFSEESREDTLMLTSAAESKLLQYDWPGNVRELRNVIQRAVVMTPESANRHDTLIDANDLHLVSAFQQPAKRADGEQTRFHAPLDLTLADLERRYIEQTLRENQGNKSRTASVLGIERSTLDRKLKRYRAQT